MTFNDTLKLALANYGDSIFPNRAAFLDHLFVTNGTGYEWLNGELVSSEWTTEAINELAQIEQFVGAGRHKKPPEDMENIPEQVHRILFGHVIPADIESRVVQTDGYNKWYPMSVGYNRLEDVPADAKPDWLNAAWECANLILSNGCDPDRRFSMYRSSFKSDDETRAHILKEHESICDIARSSMERMRTMFPEHVFQMNPAPVFDPKRAMVKGVKPWPMPGERAPFFDNIVDPFVDAIKFAYTIRRKNKGKAIPYFGYGTGDDAGSVSVEERLTADAMEWDESDQGRDALRVLIGLALQVGAELGRHVTTHNLSKELDFYFRYESIMKEIGKHVT